jgi:CHASE3 domain sensor protein
MATLDDALALIRAQRTRLESLNTYNEQLHLRIKELELAPGDQAKIDELFSELQQNDVKIEEAFSENTP